MPRFLIAAFMLMALASCDETYGLKEPVRNIAPFVPEVSADGIVHIEISGGDFFFMPNRIILKPGVPVELKVKKLSGWFKHNITVAAPEEGINFSVDFGEEPEVIHFTPTRIAIYPFYCNETSIFSSSHKSKGMEGVFEVAE